MSTTITGEHGSTEVLVFPKSFALFAHELVEGAVVAVTGRDHEGDLFAWEITPTGDQAALSRGRS